MEDFLLLDEEFTEEERLVRDNVRRFVDDKITPLMLNAYEAGEFPKHLISEMAQLGLYGMSFPENYGGSNASPVAYGLACQELERGDSAIRSFVSVQSSLCMFPIFRFGTDEQKDRFLNKMAQGEVIGCFGLTEPDSGSDPSSMKTTAKKVEGGWKLNGSKMWITNAPFADIAIVWAKTEEGIRGFIVEKDFKGYSVKETHHKLSLRVSATGELAFNDCFLPDENYLPGSDKGLAAPLMCLNQARFGIAWGAMGAAMACYESALSYLKERKQFDCPLASFQLVQKDLVDIFCEIQKALCFNLRLGRLKEQNKLNFAMISLGKLNACQHALDITRKTRNLLGANGISLEYPVMRHMNNLESVFTYEGTDNIHHLIVGKYLTGFDAFS